MSWQFPQQLLRDTALSAPGIADNCALPKKSGRLNFPYQAFAFLETVPSAPMTMGINITFGARSVNYFNITFPGDLLLSSWDILVSWHSYVKKCPFLCVFVHYSNIWLTACFGLLAECVLDSHDPSYPYFSILCNW